MRAQVLEPPVDSTSLIRLGTVGGDLVGKWLGEYPVELDDVLDVEIDARATHSFDEVQFARDSEPNFKALDEGSVTVVTGQVIEIDHVGVMTLNLRGGLLSLDMEGTAPIGLVGAMISLIIRDLEVHPTQT